MENGTNAAISVRRRQIFERYIAEIARTLVSLTGPFSVLQSIPMASSQQTLEQTKLVMAETSRLFETEVIKNRNFDALDQIYTTDARILPPGMQMISGRSSIKRFWSDLVASSNATSGVLKSVDVIPAGDCLVEIGTATLTMAPSGETSQHIEVKYVVFWRKEDGRWRWHVDIWNQNS